jgi:hypothetical protein
LGYGRYCYNFRNFKNHNTAGFYHNIFSNLVKYLDANQGALFIVNSDESSEIFLEMMACYAYQKKKHITAKIEIKEGLAG